MKIHQRAVTYSAHGVKLCVLLLGLFMGCIACGQTDPWLHYLPASDLNQGKKIVLISGDEEYRSEESMPMLAKLLTERHGFETVVLFAIDPETGKINPEYQQNIPGLSELRDADLMVIATRFRALPDEQMAHIDAFLRAGKPVIGLRTATHAFHFPEEVTSSFRHYSFNQSGGDWPGGFGGSILGETWIDHHGEHGTEGTRALVNGLHAAADHPILRGVHDIWVPSDVYGIRNTLANATILLWGQPTAGMTPDSRVMWEKSTMPIAWTTSYQLPNGEQGEVFTSTMGASIDFQNPDLRRLFVNATYALLGLSDRIKVDLNVDPVGNYEPNMFGFGSHKKEQTPSDYR